MNDAEAIAHGTKILEAELEQFRKDNSALQTASDFAHFSIGEIIKSLIDRGITDVSGQTGKHEFTFTFEAKKLESDANQRNLPTR